VFPVLALSLFLGGMTQGELWRMTLVLVNTFLLSLTVGLFASAVSRDARRAYGGNLLLLLAITAVPGAVSLVLQQPAGFGGYDETWLLTCPAYAFYRCEETAYLVRPDLYWRSLGFSHGISWLLFIAASIAVPRSWQDAPSRKGGASRTWGDFWWREGAFEQAGPRQSPNAERFAPLRQCRRRSLSRN
jgi:hypothetical protein